MSNGQRELAWFKSSYSGSQGDDCVEIAITESIIRVRDSKDITGPTCTVGGAEWERFVRFASGR
ncbi:DUF397 domain-containing protein [Streptomyces montanisoli]|uniref:DUF397 domain-containing protein n=1 Tax=Streptomyces montanisoli TaxID=2798581 RepID=A0A940RYE9_9ACTN|nr:DUF397 domain-containing protein [Streptomyces montanisoli]MBP0458604.1 DUF397 domain-containing protein [Streptomyces montanisoli]